MPGSLPQSYLEDTREKINFTGFSDWFIKYTDPAILWEAQPTFILSQLAYVIGGYVTLIHALKNGKRFFYLYLATILHGIVVEAISYQLEDVDNFWHSQAPIMLIGQRLPPHILLVYTVFMYHASVAVAKLRLPNWAEPFAVGLMVVLIDIPYDIVSVKFIHWTWHDTDPNIFDRTYWVPWNSYYFHACFAASFTFWFHFWHRRIGPQKEKWQAKGVGVELLCVILTGILGMPGGVLLFIPIYHPLHDLAHIHSEVTFMMLLTIFLLIVWSADRAPKSDNKSKDVCSKGTYLLIGHLILHYGAFLGMAVFGSPEREVSNGIHEPIGPCDEIVGLQTAFGTVLPKRRYLCANDYDEKYFDFSCLPSKKPPPDGSHWYTICGTPFENRFEYIVIISTVSLMASIIFWNIHIRTFKKKEKKL